MKFVKTAASLRRQGPSFAPRLRVLPSQPLQSGFTQSMKGRSG
jgi:hypothetical protein